MYHLTLVTLAVLLCSSSLVTGGKVLVFPVDGSHWINMKVIVEELHARGHEVTVLRPSDPWYIKEHSPYYKAININSPAGFDRDKFESYVMRTLGIRRQGASLSTRLSLVHDLMTQTSLMHKMVLQMVEVIFEDDELMQSLHNAKFDLVLTDPAFGGGAFLAHRLGLPLVFNARWTIRGEGHEVIAPSPFSYVPISGSELSDKMTFIQRVKNIMYYLFTCIQTWYVVTPNYKPFAFRHIGSDINYIEL
ncbi:UDP-glucuronosyltransferase 1A5-like, partial [Nematolebias whitei]